MQQSPACWAFWFLPSESQNPRFSGCWRTFCVEYCPHWWWLITGQFIGMERPLIWGTCRYWGVPTQVQGPLADQLSTRRTCLLRLRSGGLTHVRPSLFTHRDLHLIGRCVECSNVCYLRCLRSKRRSQIHPMQQLFAMNSCFVAMIVSRTDVRPCFATAQSGPITNCFCLAIDSSPRSCLLCAKIGDDFLRNTCNRDSLHMSRLLWEYF
jgi:hypothetical protein